MSRGALQRAEPSAILVIVALLLALAALRGEPGAQSPSPAPLPARSPAAQAQVARPGADVDAPPDSVLARIDRLRAAGDLAGAREKAGELVRRLASDPASRPWHRDDAALAARTIDLALALPASDRRELIEADSLRAHMRTAWEAGSFAEARADCERQLEIRRRILGPDHPEVATATNDLGVLLKMQGDYAGAEPLMRAALADHLRLQGRLHPEVVNTLNNLSCLLRERGDYNAAEPLAREALAGSLQMFPRDDPVVATHLNNLGGVCYYLGDYARAEPLFREALAIRRRKLPEDHDETVQSLNNVAFLHKAQGDLAAAEALFREALAMQRRLRGNEHPVVASHIQNLANTLATQGQHAEAVALHTEGLEILRRRLGDEHPRVPQAMSSLAASVAALGDTARADTLLREALDLRRRALGSHHPEVAWSLARLGRLEQARGRFDEALALHREALEIRRRSFGRTHLLIARSLGDLGALRLARGQYAAAETLLAEAAQIFEVARLRAGSGIERATFEASPYRDLAVARLLLDEPAGAWVAAERAQGRGLADLLSAARQRRLAPAETAREDSLKDALARLESRIQALAGADVGAGPPSERSDPGNPAPALRALRNELLATQADWCAFERAIAERHPVSEGQAFALERVQAALGARTAIVGWIEGEIAPSRHPAWGYVVRDRGPVRWVALDPTAADRHGRSRGEAAAAYRRALAVAGAWPLRISATDRIARDAQELGRLWLEPLLPHLAGIEQLVVVPAGPMLGIPVETLAREDGRPAGDLFTVSYAPSATVFAWLREQGRAHAAGAAALLIGDPPFSPAHLAAMGSPGGRDHPAAAGTGRSGGASDDPLKALPRLPGTRAEVLRAAELLPRAVTLLGPDASEQNLVRLAAGDELRAFDLIHVGTHALVDTERPDRSALVLARAGLPDPIVAAAAGERVYDGLVTMADIVRDWRLDADLVTLSGCRTGLGREAGGEGYVGLAHAFLQAGARCVLVSQWPVDDETTALLMERFYENLAGFEAVGRGFSPGAPVSFCEALREARCWLRARGGRHGDHPALWAGFVLVGAPGAGASRVGRAGGESGAARSVTAPGSGSAPPR